MINPKHPLHHTQQEFFIKYLSEENKEYHTLRISYSNAVYLYYDLQLNVSTDHYEEWLNEMTDDHARNTMQLKGFEECQKTFSFIRFIQKKRNITETDYIREKMGNVAYDRYKTLIESY